MRRRGVDAHIPSDPKDWLWSTHETYDPVDNMILLFYNGGFIPHYYIKYDTDDSVRIIIIVTIVIGPT